MKYFLNAGNNASENGIYETLRDAKKAWTNAGSANHDKGNVWVSHLQMIDGILETVGETVLARW